MAERKSLTVHYRRMDNPVGALNPHADAAGASQYASWRNYGSRQAWQADRKGHTPQLSCARVPFVRGVLSLLDVNSDMTLKAITRRHKIENTDRKVQANPRPMILPEGYGKIVKPEGE